MYLEIFSQNGIGTLKCVAKRREASIGEGKDGK